MLEAVLVFYTLILFHLVWNLQRRSRRKGIDNQGLAYAVGITLISFPWFVMIRWERLHNISAAIFLTVVSAVFFLLSRKPVEEFIDRLNL